jgi:hypothetical protein
LRIEELQVKLRLTGMNRLLLVLLVGCGGREFQAGAADLVALEAGDEGTVDAADEGSVGDAGRDARERDSRAADSRASDSGDSGSVDSAPTDSGTADAVDSAPADSGCAPSYSCGDAGVVDPTTQVCFITASGSYVVGPTPGNCGDTCGAYTCACVTSFSFLANSCPAYGGTGGTCSQSGSAITVQCD